jgi:hypothetical protein
VRPDLRIAAQSSPCMNAKIIDQATQEHSMDALAVRGDEGRGTLR